MHGSNSGRVTRALMMQATGLRDRGSAPRPFAGSARLGRATRAFELLRRYTEYTRTLRNGRASSNTIKSFKCPHRIEPLNAIKWFRNKRRTGRSGVPRSRGHSNRNHTAPHLLPAPDVQFPEHRVPLAATVPTAAWGGSPGFLSIVAGTMRPSPSGVSGRRRCDSSPFASEPPVQPGPAQRPRLDPLRQFRPRSQHRAELRVECGGFRRASTTRNPTGPAGRIVREC
jgi:hypothetical protein